MGKIFTFSGARGVGKTSIIDDLSERCGVSQIVPYTTRPIRVDQSEVDGRDYHFVGQDEFEAISNAEGMFDTLRLGSNRYGTPNSAFKNAIAAPDGSVEGIHTINVAAATALQLAAEFNPTDAEDPTELAVHCLFVLPRCWKNIRQQMNDKGMAQKDIEARLQSEPTDLTLLPQFDTIIINGYGRREGAFRAAADYIMEVTNVYLPNVSNFHSDN